MERERLGSRLGFILISAGCAIGCGNVWKFPWMTGQNGGGAFVLVYIICLILFGLVISLELVNTAVESTVDLVTEEKRPLAKKAKDTAAGAVLVSAIAAAIIGLMIFIPRIIDFFR